MKVNYYLILFLETDLSIAQYFQRRIHNMASIGAAVSNLLPSIASYMFIFTTLNQLLPHIFRGSIWERIRDFFKPYTKITIYEYTKDLYKRNEAYVAVETYLAAKSTSLAKYLTAEYVKKNNSIMIAIDGGEVVHDEFKGVKVEWRLVRKESKSKLKFVPDHMHFELKFHRQHCQIVNEQYLNHIWQEYKAITASTRQKKLYSNIPSNNWWDFRRNLWNCVPFDHPSTFNSLAMDPKKKQEIINDLIRFSKAKEYYAKIGKPWKRGYLLHGPPGTGKSTMIAAMANLLNYDVYDIELTAVKNNTELRRLLSDISSKSLIVIEDIDCSLDLTGQRSKKIKDRENKDPAEKVDDEEGEEEKSESMVTLSGLLNFIDGIWSASVGERIIVFTTNHVDKLDPALIRRGRMDKHIELSYCKFEAFKVLAKNYLDIDFHPLFEKIQCLLEDVDMTPADVAENLTPTTPEPDPDACLHTLVQALENAKREANSEATEDGELIPSDQS